MSFTGAQDHVQQNEGDKLTFKVGEREFNAESAATKINAADEHIGKVETENAQLREQIAKQQADLEKATKLDDALAQLKANQANTQNSPPPTETPTVSEEQIGAIANKQIEDFLAAQRVKDAQSAAETLAEETYKATGEQLATIYGDKVDEAVNNKAAELGVNPQELYGMAKNPTTAKMLLETMKVSSPAATATPTGSINSAPYTHKAPEKFMEYGGNITSSVITDALKKADATY